MFFCVRVPYVRLVHLATGPTLTLAMTVCILDPHFTYLNFRELVCNCSPCPVLHLSYSLLFRLSRVEDEIQEAVLFHLSVKIFLKSMVLLSPPYV